jgi:hypothetical protein
MTLTHFLLVASLLDVVVAQTSTLTWTHASTSVVLKDGSINAAHNLLRLWYHDANVVTSSGLAIDGARVSSWRNGCPRPLCV